MNAYTDFATVYDLFMEEVPYDQWLSFLEEIWRKEGLQPEVIADLGCGTCRNSAGRLSWKWYG